VIDRINGRLALLLAVAGVLILMLAGWYVIVSPQRSKAAQLDGRIGDANIKLAATEALLRSPAARESVGKLKRLRVALPDDVKMSEILRQLSAASAASGVRIDSITPSPPVASTAGQAVPISLSLSGHYFRLAKFMHLLRSRAEVKDGVVHASGRLYAIDNISFSSDKGGLITAAVILDAFVYAPPAPTATSTAGGDSSTGTTTTTPTTTTTGS
jgi:Pilus assembly protein, PilO